MEAWADSLLKHYSTKLLVWPWSEVRWSYITLTLGERYLDCVFPSQASRYHFQVLLSWTTQSSRHIKFSSLRSSSRSSQILTTLNSCPSVQSYKNSSLSPSRRSPKPPRHRVQILCARQQTRHLHTRGPLGTTVFRNTQAMAVGILHASRASGALPRTLYTASCSKATIRQSW